MRPNPAFQGSQGRASETSRTGKNAGVTLGSQGGGGACPSLECGKGIREGFLGEEAPGWDFG